MKRSKTKASSPRTPLEERYQHVGTDHLIAIGDSSASLGLISTLVFSICISSIMQESGTTREIMELFLSLASAFSTYTTTYSLLEYYYVQTLKCVDSFMASRVNVDVDGSGDQHHNLMDQDTGGTERLLEDRAKLVAELENAFASFNNMRMWARNAMWSSLICLLGSAVTKVDPLSGVLPEVSSSTSIAAFFAVMASGLVCAWFAGFQSRDIQAYFLLSALGMMLASLEARFGVPGLQTGKIMATVFLLGSIAIIPCTVRSFRETYLVLAKKYAKIF